MFKEKFKKYQNRWIFEIMYTCNETTNVYHGTNQHEILNLKHETFQNSSGYFVIFQVTNPWIDKIIISILYPYKNQKIFISDLPLFFKVTLSTTLLPFELEDSQSNRASVNPPMKCISWKCGILIEMTCAKSEVRLYSNFGSSDSICCWICWMELLKTLSWSRMWPS